MLGASCNVKHAACDRFGLCGELSHAWKHEHEHPAHKELSRILCLGTLRGLSGIAQAQWASCARPADEQLPRLLCAGDVLQGRRTLTHSATEHTSDKHKASKLLCLATVSALG